MRWVSRRSTVSDPAERASRFASVEDIRVAKRQKIVERPRRFSSDCRMSRKELVLTSPNRSAKPVQVEEMTIYGPEHLPAGPNIDQADALIVVEARPED